MKGTTLALSVMLMLAITVPGGALGAFKHGRESLNILGGGVSRVISYPGSRLLLMREGSYIGVLALLRANGSIDRSFGINGILSIPWNDAVVEPNGKILVVAKGPMPGVQTGTDLTVTRLRPNGKLDPTFGKGGIVTLNLGRPFNEGTAVALAPGGKILIAGVAVSTFSSRGGDDGVAVFGRLLSDGRLDPSFGNGGLVTYPNYPNIGRSVALAATPDGGVLAAGERGRIARLTSSGALNVSFGKEGEIELEIFGQFFGPSLEFFFPVEGLRLRPDGGFQVAGTLSNSVEEHIVYAPMTVRYLANGELDTSYGTGGRAMVTVPGSFGASAIALQRNGSVVVAGEVQPNNQDQPPVSDFGAVRFNPSGGLDRSFGRGGKVRVGFRGWDRLAGVVIQPPGRVILVGSSTVEGRSPETRISLARIPLVRHTAR